MKIAKVFHFLNFIILLNILIACLEGAESEQDPDKALELIKIVEFDESMEPLIGQINTRSAALSYFGTYNKDPFDEVMIINKKAWDHILTVYNGSSKEQKNLMLKDYTGLSGFVKYFLGAYMDSCSEKHNDFLLHSLIYELKKKHAEELEDADFNEIRRNIQFFWEKERQDRTISLFWFKIMSSIKCIFGENKVFSSLNKTEKDKIWCEWYVQMREEWMCKQTFYIKTVVELMDKGMSPDDLENHNRSLEYMLNSCIYYFTSLSKEYLKGIKKYLSETKEERNGNEQLASVNESASTSKLRIEADSKLESICESVPELSESEKKCELIPELKPESEMQSLRGVKK